MNTTVINGLKETTLCYQPGDIFKSYSTGGVYILSILGNENYAAIRLNTGIRWSIESPTIGCAVQGLTFVGRNAKITIDF